MQSVDGSPKPAPPQDQQTSPPRDPQSSQSEIGELRSEVERLAAELESLRAHAASLEALAHEDQLTGLLNRRGFTRDLARAAAYRGRYGTGVALLLVDLDHFKPINDRHGHEAGDRALQHVAGHLRRNVRASDSVGRLGGDEFAVILWNVDEATAAQKAASLAALLDGNPLRIGETTIAIAASIGVTPLVAGDGVEEALARADRAMYAEKARRRAGR